MGETVAVYNRAGVPVGSASRERMRREGLWHAAASVLVLSPEGELLGRVPVPEVVANVCFGPENAHGGQDLYVAASTSLYRISTAVRSAEPR